MTLRFLVTLVLAAANTQAAPNILLILADDLAWSDLGCYGSKTCETPNLDKLARQGIRYTDAYAAAPLCSPARAALMTGRSPARLNFEFVTKWTTDKPYYWPAHKVVPPPYTFNLPLEETTIAEVLRDAGYQTAMVGKWHLNTHYKTYNGWSPEFGPRQQGFEHAVETFGSHPWAYRDKTEPTFDNFAPGEYAPDSLTDATIDFLENRDSTKPYFLFASLFYVHSPVRPRGEWLVEKYRRKLGQAGAEDHAVYCSFVETLDWHVGRLLDAVDTDTLVVFTSDNGGHPQYAANAPLRGSKWNLYEGGIRAPLIVRWPEGAGAGETNSDPIIGTDLFATFAEMAGAKSAAEDSVALTRRGSAEHPLVWHFPYYHPERGFPESPKTIGVGDRYVSQTRPSSAIRVANDKLIYYHDDKSVELYNLGRDLSEQHNLAKENPRRADALRQQLLSYLEAANARWPTSVSR